MLSTEAEEAMTVHNQHKIGINWRYSSMLLNYDLGDYSFAQGKDDSTEAAWTSTFSVSPKRGVQRPKKWQKNSLQFRSAIEWKADSGLPQFNLHISLESFVILKNIFRGNLIRYSISLNIYILWEQGDQFKDIFQFARYALASF